MEKLPERIRIKDIARLAGVSVGTVDRGLHGRAGVSPKSRESVEAVLQQLDYQPNMYASALATNKKYLFAYILPKHDEGSYWCDIEKGLNYAVRTYNDFHISIAPFYYDPYIPETFEECSKGVVDLSPDGVVLSPSTPEKTFSLTKELKRKGIPFVFFDSNMPDLWLVMVNGRYRVVILQEVCLCFLHVMSKRSLSSDTFMQRMRRR